MVRALKWAGVFLSGLGALFILAALLLPALVNVERYRTLLAGRVSKALGRHVALDALTVHLWRGIGAEAKGVRIAQAPGFGSEPFLTADALRVHLQLLPLLRGQMKVSALTLERPRIRVLLDSDGRWSIEDLLRGAPMAAPGKPGPEPPRARAPQAGAVLLSEVAVRDGEIFLATQGRPGGATLHLADVYVRARQQSLGVPVEIELRATLASPGGGTIASTGRLSLGDLENPTLDLSVVLAGMEVAPWQAALQAGTGAASLSGTLRGEIKLAGPLDRVGFSGQADLKGLGIRVGQRFEKAEGEPAGLNLEGRREGPGLVLSAWRVGLKGMALEGTLRIPDLSRLHLVFTAASPELDVDRLLRPPKPTATWLLPASAWAAPAPPPAPESGGGPSADGTLNVGQLKYAGLTWRDVGADLRYREGVLYASRIRAFFLGGTIQAQAEVDLRPKEPRVKLTSRLDDVQTAPLARALSPGEFTLESRLTLDSQVSFAGSALPDILGSASGQGRLHLGEGRLRNYPPLDRLAEVLAPILASQGIRIRLDEFKQLDGTYTLGNGILRTPDLTLLKQEGSIVASGTLGLLDRSVNMDVVARLGRTTVEAKVTGTTDKPIVVPKLGRFQRRLETEIDKLVPEGQGKSLKDLFKQFFR